MIKTKKEKLPAPGFYLSCERVKGGLAVTVGGVIGVSDFTDERAELTSHTGRINVSGRGLSITVFENKSIEISGAVKDISFVYGKA